MAIYTKPISASGILNGNSVVCNGNTTQVYYTTERIHTVASGDSLIEFQTLNGRFKVAPTGWSA